MCVQRNQTFYHYENVLNNIVPDPIDESDTTIRTRFYTDISIALIVLLLIHAWITFLLYQLYK